MAIGDLNFLKCQSDEVWVSQLISCRTTKLGLANGWHIQNTMLHKMTHRWIQTYSNYVEVDFTSIHQLAFSSQNAWSLICTSLGSLQNEARKLPSGNQTWFAGKSPIYKDYVPIYINAYNLWAMSHCHVWLPEGSSSSISGSANPFGFRGTSVGPSGMCSRDLSRDPLDFCCNLQNVGRCWKSGSQNCRCKKILDHLGPLGLKILSGFHKIHGIIMDYHGMIIIPLLKNSHLGVPITSHVAAAKVRDLPSAKSVSSDLSRRPVFDAIIVDDFSRNHHIIFHTS